VQHDLVISAMDWHPVTNKLITASHDRNAFVWHFDTSKNDWEPTVCMLGIDRAALDVKWSPDGNKFAVGSGNKNAIVCWFDPANNWWIGKPCKREKAKSTAHSSVCAVSWHPNSQILAVASTDYRARVLYAHVEEVDVSANGAQFGTEHEFGEVLAEFEQTRAWVNDIAWSPSAAQLAFIGHDGLIHITAFDASGKSEPVTQVRQFACLDTPH
jgi:actin related protein 2/3 complex subunit 1A/1B